VSPTLTFRATQAGVIMGTAAYMSPEQARGKPVDKRADIWAFGVVLYEMLAGRQLYGDGETVSDTIAAILTREPDLDALPAETPPRIRKLIATCLRKDHKARLRDIGDARLILDEPDSGAVSLPAAPARRPILPWAIAGVFAAALLAVAPLAWRAGRSAPPAPLMRLSLTPPPETSIDYNSNPVAISEDGSRVAVALRGADGASRIYTRTLQEPTLTAVAGLANADSPFCSPDGQWIGFVDLASSKLRRVAVGGGAALEICDTPAFRGASWGDDGNIRAAINGADTLISVPASGGAPRPLTPLKAGERTQRWPQVLPGSRAVIFTSHTANADYDHANIDVLVAQTGERRTLVQNGFAGRCIDSGHLIYLHANTLFAAPFDLEKLTITGAATPVLDGVFNGAIAGAGLPFPERDYWCSWKAAAC
jgi:serine/threonine-protein kinase